LKSKILDIIHRRKDLNIIMDIVSSLFVIFHPAFFLLTIYNELKQKEMGNLFGVVFIGICLGIVLYKLGEKLNPHFKSAAGVIFLITPLILFLLTFFFKECNTNFFWIVFTFIYVVSGAVLFVKNNPDGLNKTELCVISLCVPFLILALIINFVNRGINYSPDSYGYYDISRSIFSNFGFVNVTRQYIEFTDYGISFPYLFPALISVFDFFTGFGILSGTCINIIATLFSLYYMSKISSRLTESAIPGLIIALILFFSPDFLSEMINSRAVPLSILCALLIINALTSYSGSGKPGKLQLFLAGVFAGAGMVIRFDFLAVAGLLGVILLFVYNKKMFKFVPFYVFGLLVFTTPWILYSIIHFNKIWISDNGGTLFLINAMLPQRFFIPTEVVPDIFSDPKKWITSHQTIVMNGLSGFFSIITRPVELVMLLGIAATGILSKIKFSDDNEIDETSETNEIYEEKKKSNKRFKLLFILTIVVYCIKTFAVIMVGYADLRYHMEAMTILSLIILCAIYRSLDTRKIWICFTVVVFSMSVIVNLQPMFKDSIQPKLLNAFINTAAITPDDETLAIEKVLKEATGEESADGFRLFYVDTNPYNAYKLGAYTKIKTYARISNINEERLLYLMKNYIKPEYIYLPPAESTWLHFLSEHFIMNMLSETPPIYTAAELSPLGDDCIRLSSTADSNWDRGISTSYSSLFLVRNSKENRAKLKDAVALESGGAYAGIEEMIYKDDNWIHVRCVADIDTSTFVYPNEIKIMK